MYILIYFNLREKDWNFKDKVWLFLCATAVKI